MMMRTLHPTALTLGLPARTSYLHVATHFAESSAAAYGLGKDDGLKLGLAVEEIFMHLCTAVCPEQPLEILRTIHSFDPCLACSTHVMSPDGQELAKVKVR